MKSLGTVATDEPTVPAPDDRWLYIIGGMMIGRKMEMITKNMIEKDMEG